MNCLAELAERGRRQHQIGQGPADIWQADLIFAERLLADAGNIFIERDWSRAAVGAALGMQASPLATIFRQVVYKIAHRSLIADGQQELGA